MGTIKIRLGDLKRILKEEVEDTYDSYDRERRSMKAISASQYSKIYRDFGSRLMPLESSTDPGGHTSSSGIEYYTLWGIKDGGLEIPIISSASRAGKKEFMGNPKYLSEGVLREADENDDVEKEDGNDSLDNQVDKYFGDYEAEAKSAKTEGADWRRTVRRIVEETDTEEESSDDDLFGDAAGDSSKLSEDAIDLGNFTNSIIRLIDNYDSLLEVRNTILRRASNFLNKNYDDSVVEQFKNTLREDHGLEIGKSQEETSADEFAAPAAGAAGPAGASGAGV